MARLPKKEEEHYKTICVSFSPEEEKKLRDYCEKEERPIAWVIRKALAMFYKKEGY